MRPHQGRAEGKENLPDLLATLLLMHPRIPLPFLATRARCWLVVNLSSPSTPSPSPQSCSPAGPPQPVLVPGVVPPWLPQSKGPGPGRLWGHQVPQNNVALLQGGSWSGRDRWPGHRARGLPCAECGCHTHGKQALAKPRHTEHRFVHLTQEIPFQGSLGRAVLLAGQRRRRGRVQILTRGRLRHGFVSIMKALHYGHHNRAYGEGQHVLAF